MYELLHAMDIPLLSLEGYEADDIIGTIITKLRHHKDYEIRILSGDKDLYQFIGENVCVYDTMKRTVARSKETHEKF